MTEELKPCPFCGSAPVMKHIGNDHTKSRAVEVKCSNVYCRVARTDKALRHDHAWLTKVATENWNRRVESLAAPAVANAAAGELPPLPKPFAVKKPIDGQPGVLLFSPDQMQAYARAAIAAQTRPAVTLTDEQIEEIGVHLDCFQAKAFYEDNRKEMTEPERIDYWRHINFARSIEAAAAPNAQLVDALQRIERNQCEVFDEDLGEMVEVCMDTEDMIEIARAALVSLPPQKEAL